MNKLPKNERIRMTGKDGMQRGMVTWPTLEIGENKRKSAC
jgi:hypothetical protein